jgi:hypothetical protein
VTAHPDGPWTAQQARNLVMDLREDVAQFRFLVRDRAGLFAGSFDAVVTDAGIEVVKIPAVRGRTVPPSASLTIRTELTDRMPIFGERHLRSVLAVYAAHYNRRRPHRALQLRPPRGSALSLSRHRQGPASTGPRWPDQRVRTRGMNRWSRAAAGVLEPRRGQIRPGGF